MLFNLLHSFCQNIEALNIEEASKMREQIMLARPNIGNLLTQSTTDEETRKLVENEFAKAVLNSIKEIPDIVDLLVRQVQNFKTPNQIKCGLATVLCYLVQPRDLIPDDAPGGYGFVDDNVIIRAGLIEFLKRNPLHDWNVEHQVQHLQMAAGIVSPALLPPLQMCVERVSTTFQILDILKSSDVKELLKSAITDPLQYCHPPTPTDFIPTLLPHLRCLDGRFEDMCLASMASLSVGGGGVGGNGDDW